MLTDIPDDSFISITMEYHFQRIQFIARYATIHFDKAVLQVIVRELHISFKLTSIADQKKQNYPKHDNLPQEWP